MEQDAVRGVATAFCALNRRHLIGDGKAHQNAIVLSLFAVGSDRPLRLLRGDGGSRALGITLCSDGIGRVVHLVGHYVGYRLEHEARAIEIQVAKAGESGHLSARVAYEAGGAYPVQTPDECGLYWVTRTGEARSGRLGRRREQRLEPFEGASRVVRVRPTDRGSAART